MILHTSPRRALAVVVAITVVGWPSHVRGQSAPVIELAARTTARNEAARALVPLLKEVRRRARIGTMSIRSGTLADSPFTRRRSTLCAFTLARRVAPADPRALEAADRLLAWKIGDPRATEDAALFDEWLDRLSIMSAVVGTRSDVQLCDASCVVARMARLGAERRDRVLLDALVAVVSK